MSTKESSVRKAAALVIAAALSVSLAAPAVAAPTPLQITSVAAVRGTLPGGDLGQLVAAEAPDGAVYVASLADGKQTVWSVSTAGVVHLADRVTGVGAITALAVDSTYVYVGTPQAITAYSRSNGAFTRRWALSPTPRALSQLVVAGNRVWGLLTPLGFTRKPSSLVELDPTSPARVRTVNGINDVASIAAGPSAIFYVSDKSSTLVRLTNAGVRTSASTLLTVNLELSGPGAIQAELLQGNHVIVRFAAGQGLDAVTYVYNATTLAGPGGPGVFSALSTLGNTSLGLLEATAPGENGCPSTGHPCLERYAVGSGGPIPPVLTLPYDEASAPLGPLAAVVVRTGSALHVLRIS
jgi:hypothetical protein